MTRSRTLPWKRAQPRCVCVCARVRVCTHVHTQARAHGCKLTYLVVLLRVGWGLTGRIPLACPRLVLPCTLSSRVGGWGYVPRGDVQEVDEGSCQAEAVGGKRHFQQGGGDAEAGSGSVQRHEGHSRGENAWAGRTHTVTAEPPRAPTPGPDRPARTYGREELPDDDEPDDFSGGEEVGQEAAKHGAGDGGGRQQGRQEPALRLRRGRGPARPPAVPQPGPGMPTRWLSFTRTSPLTQTPRRWNWPPRLE